MRPTVLVLAATLLAGSTRAQTFPPTPSSGTVYDGARLLSAEDVNAINEASRTFQRDTGAPIVVATFPSLESVGAKGMGIERFSTGLFNAWRIGRRDEGRNGGILLVVAKADRKVKIELGRDWRRDYDAGARRINQETILPAFRGGDFSGGIVRGVQALAGLASSAPTSGQATAPPAGFGGAMPSGDSTMAPMGMPVEESGWFPGGLLCLGVPILLFVFVAGAMARRRRSYGNGFGGGPYVDQGADDGFVAGMVAGQMMSQPTYDPGPMYDPGPSFDAGGSDGGFDSGGSFDSGDSGGGGDSGSW